MRFKFDTTNPTAFRCCFCCHVRTGTIFLGVFGILFELIGLAAFAIMLIHPEVLQLADKVVVISDPQLIGEENASLVSFNWILPQQSSSEDRFFCLLLWSGLLTITSMLVYGAIRGRPGYLMPFFCVQVFHFCMTCLSGVGYFSYIPDIKRWIAEMGDVPYKEEILAMDSDWLMLMFVLSFALVLLVEAYLIGVVWACYKYLIQYERNVAAGNLPQRAYASEERPEDTEMLLPPKYEDAIRQSAEEPPPPPYSSTADEEN